MNQILPNLNLTSDQTRKSRSQERKVCYSAVYPRWYLANIAIGIAILMGRCVARSPKEMVRQVAAVKELDEAEVSFANNNFL